MRKQTLFMLLLGVTMLLATGCTALHRSVHAEDMKPVPKPNQSASQGEKIPEIKMKLNSIGNIELTDENGKPLEEVKEIEPNHEFVDADSLTIVQTHSHLCYWVRAGGTWYRVALHC